MPRSPAHARALAPVLPLPLFQSKRLLVTPFTGFQSPPALVRLPHDAHGHLHIQRLAMEAVGVLGLALGGLIKAEPIAHLMQQAGKVALHVGHRAHRLGPRIVRPDGQQLPVGLAAVDQCQHADRFHRHHCAHRQRLRADLNHVHRVVVAPALRVRVEHRRVLPGLRQRAVIDQRRAIRVVPQLAVLDVLLQRVPLFAGGDLHLRGGALGYLVDVVQQQLALVGEEGNVVPRRYAPGGVLRVVHPAAVLVGRPKVDAELCSRAAPSRVEKGGRVDGGNERGCTGRWMRRARRKRAVRGEVRTARAARAAQTGPTETPNASDVSRDGPECILGENAGVDGCLGARARLQRWRHGRPSVQGRTPWTDRRARPAGGTVAEWGPCARSLGGGSRWRGPKMNSDLLGLEGEWVHRIDSHNRPFQWR
eukprot:ctg_2874.g397